MHQKIVDKITELGLTEKKATVYANLLAMGSATADELAKASKLNRSTTYVQLEALMQDGLVSKFKVGKKTKFSTESPLNLNAILQSQKEELELREAKMTSLLPELMALFSTIGERPLIRYFEGIGGLKSLRKEILNVSSGEYLAAASIDNMQKLFSKAELNDFSEKRKQKNIRMKLLYNSAHDNIKSIGNQQLKRVDAANYPFEADVYIYDNKVSFANTTEKVGGVIIESAAIAQTMRSVFNLLWVSLDDG